jgi:hypothetical protein
MVEPLRRTLALCALFAACAESTPPGNVSTLDGATQPGQGSLGGASGFGPPPATFGIDAGALARVIYRDAGSYEFGDAESPADDDGGAGLTLTGPNTILVVVDRSGSMATAWEGGTRWKAGNAAMVAALLPFREELTLAALQFPLRGDCNVVELDAPGQYPFTTGEQFLGAWSEAYPSTLPTGGTPLQAALAAADRAIADAIAAGLFEHKFKVMLVTDGEPTCDDDATSIVAFPARWTELGVRTYVLGLPGSAPAAELLQSIAEAGGSGTFRQIGDPGQLAHDIAAAAAE